MTDDDRKRAHVALQGLLGRGPTPAEVACLAATLSDVEHAERERLAARLRAKADGYAAKVGRYQQQGRPTLQMLASETARVLREQAAEIEAEQ